MRRWRTIGFIVLGIVLAILVLMGLAMVTGQLRLVSMNSRSMDSDNGTNRSGSIHEGDLALVTKGIRGALHRGALVVVDFNNLGQRVTTVRRITGVPGDRVPNPPGTNSMTNIPPGYYFVAGDSTNALDSRQLGLVSAGQISGRVVFVIK